MKIMHHYSLTIQSVQSENGKIVKLYVTKQWWHVWQSLSIFVHHVANRQYYSTTYRSVYYATQDDKYTSQAEHLYLTQNESRYNLKSSTKMEHTLHVVSEILLVWI